MLRRRSIIVNVVNFDRFEFYVFSNKLMKRVCYYVYYKLLRLVMMF